MSELAGTLLLGAILVASIYGLDLLVTRAERAPAGQRTRNFVLTASGVISAAMVLLGLVGMAASAARDQDPDAGSMVLLASGMVGLVILLPGGRALLARLLPFDAGSLRDTLGLLLILWVVVLQIGEYVSGDEDIGTEGGEVSALALFFQAAIFIAVSLAAVGLFTRRCPREALERLGLRAPTTGTVLAGMGLVIPMLIAALLSVVAADAIRPGTSEDLAETLEGIAGDDPGLGIALAIAITASTGEELLFRGLIQPRYGVLFTALVFALLHVQYDLLLNLLSLAPAGVILGLERRYLGTTACIVTHGLYNLVAVLST